MFPPFQMGDGALSDGAGSNAALALDGHAAPGLDAGKTSFQELINHLPAVVYVNAFGDPDTPLYVSSQVEAMLGYTVAQWLGDPELRIRIVHPDDHARVQSIIQSMNSGGLPHGPQAFEYRVMARDGRLVWIRNECNFIAASPHAPASWQGVLIDVTERKKLETRLEHQAYHDLLTGLPNRALFMDRLEAALARRARDGGNLAVLFLDLDRFKIINDSLGHEAGDRVLLAAARRLNDCLRPGDTLARLGGDEFTILLETVEGTGSALIVAARVIEALRAPLKWDGDYLVVSASIGVVLAMPEGGGADGILSEKMPRVPLELLRDADIALYRAKDRGGGCYELFDGSMNAAAVRRLQLESELRLAIERGEFEAYYQPKIELSTGQMVAIEALARWNHPERGLVMPGEFIPIAEEIGLILSIGREITLQACHQLKAWQREFGVAAPQRVCVNLSACQFGFPGLCDEIASALKASELDADCLSLELTETTVMHDAELQNIETTMALLHKIKALGVRLSLDDFGTGYSSLYYLKQFPLNVLKIDKSFVADIGREIDAPDGDTDIMCAILTLAHAYNLLTVAEGIETPEQAARLLELGCDIGQGYHFGRPMPAAQLTERLHAERVRLESAAPIACVEA